MRANILEPYCLYCYAPLEPKKAICSRCDRTSPVSQRQKYWTREPKLVEVEGTLKMVILVLTFLAALIILFYLPGATFMAGWFLAIPFLIGAPLWATAGCLTTRGGHFSATWFWVAVLLLLAAAGILIHLVVSLFFYTLTAGTVLYFFLFRQWKHRRIERGQNRAVNSGTARE